MIAEIVLPEANGNDSILDESRLNKTSTKVQQGGANVLPAIFDINMMVVSGRERTESEWKSLLGSVGLRVTRIEGPELAAKEGGWTMDSIIEAVVEKEG